MPAGGQLTIETANATLDSERIADEGLSLPAGEYVMLRSSDTGTGMDDATRARAFEPFFTTKPKGKGTGLGLATVYGIVDQSGGQVALTSAPGRGTAVGIYLPATKAHAETRKPQLVASADERGTETVLLVEDNESVRELAVKALRRRGYTVYEARDAEEAIAWSARRGNHADLLVTDIVMPGLSGPNLAARLMQQNAALRVLYSSGYTDEANAVQGAYLAGVPLLQKPFTPARLAERVRVVLDTSHA
jgi:CheY-like chemotaxis protein